VSTHTTVRTAIASVVTGLTVDGVALTVSDSSDAVDMYAHEQMARRVCILIEDAPGDEWGGTRAYVATLSAACMRGLSETAARDSLALLARALRSGMIDDLADTNGIQVIDASTDTIGRDGDSVVLRQTYQLRAAA